MSKNSVIIEGYVLDDVQWGNKGRTARVQTSAGEKTVAFSAQLLVPQIGVRVRIQGNKGKVWIFPEKWEYLCITADRTESGFPIKV